MLPQDQLVSWSADRSLRVWNWRTGDTLAQFDTKISSVEKLLFGRKGHFICLMESSGVRLVSTRGVELAVLKRQIEPIEAVHQLADGRWLTRADLDVRLWSAAGRLQRKFRTPFSFESGYAMLADESLLVVDTANTVMLLGHDGRLIAKRAADLGMAPDILGLMSAREKARSAMSARPSFERFEHRSSPISRPSIPSDELSKLAIPTTQLQRDGSAWDFFNRPDIKRIRAWMREEIQVAAAARDRIDEAACDHRERELRARKWRDVAIGGLHVSLVSLLISHSVMARDIVNLELVPALTSLCFIWTQHRVVRKMASARRVLEHIRPETENLILELQTHRRRILASLPVARSSGIYSGAAIQMQIKAIIDGELRETALDHAGVLASDIISDDGDPIVVSDWALMHLEYGAGQEKVPLHTLGSFWWTADAGFIFAVQSIQYVILTQQKIDVFMVVYDFVRQCAVRKTLHSFNYQDVTNVTSRDVERQAIFSRAGHVTDVTTIEVVLYISGSPSIAVTLLDEESAAAALRSGNQRGTTGSRGELRRDLEAERTHWLANASHPQQRQELEALDAQIAALDAERMPTAVESESYAGRARRVIAGIRRQILTHKHAPAP